MAGDATPGGGPPPPADRSTRTELVDAPPFLTWGRIYLIVLGALAVEIALAAAITAVYR